MTRYYVLAGEDIFTVATKLYGNASYSNKLILDNSLTFGQNIDGLTLVFDESIIQQKVFIATPKAVVSAPDYDFYFIHNGMTIYDVSIQLYGDISMVSKLLADNNLSLYDNIEGLNLKYLITANSTTNILKVRGYFLNTGNSEHGKIESKAFDSGAFSSAFH